MDKDALLGALKSKTMWVFAPTGAVALFDWLANHGELVSAILSAVGLNPSAGIAILSALGVILRAVTTKPLADK